MRDCAQRGEFDAVVVLSPDRLARNSAHQWLLIEEFEKLRLQWLLLQHPFGDSPPGKLLPHMPGMLAESERAQIHERRRPGRWEKARLPRYRQTEEHPRHSLKPGRSYRPEHEGVWSEAPALMTGEVFEKVQLQLQRNAAVARKMYQPTSCRDLLRTLVKCGACGLGCGCIRPQSGCQTSESLSYEGKGPPPLTCGRVTKCQSRRGRADRLDPGVWRSLCQLLPEPP